MIGQAIVFGGGGGRGGTDVTTCDANFSLGIALAFKRKNEKEMN